MISKRNLLLRRVMCGLLFTFHFSLFTASAQEKLEVDFDAALVSHYMWRGQDLGNVCFQPEIGIAWKGLELSAEGSTGFTRDEFEELDLHLLYNYKGFKIGVSDMWVEDAPDSRYFYYKSRETGHQFEGRLGYECDYGSLTWNTVFAGNDFRIDGKRAYSTFIELSVPFKFFDLEWDFRLGLCPWESAGAVLYYEDEDDDGNETIGKSSFYSYNSGFGVNMASLRATKSFPLGKGFKLPVFVELHTNPAAQSARILFGISLATL